MDKSYSTVIVSTPVLRSGVTSDHLALYIIIAAMPAIVWSCARLGLCVLITVLTCAVSCAVFESVFLSVTRKSLTLSIIQPMSMGVILALTMPAASSVLILIAAAFIATVIIRNLCRRLFFGILSPVVTAKLVFDIFLSKQMRPDYVGIGMGVKLESFSTPLPIDWLKNGEIPTESLFDLFFGNQSEVIGGISVAMALLGGFYLLYKRVITWHVPVCFIGAAAIFLYLISPEGLELGYVGASLCSGALIFGAFFLAADHSIAPLCSGAKMVYGVLGGVLTIAIRQYTPFFDDVILSIFIIGVLSHILDRLLRPSVFGRGKR